PGSGRSSSTRAASSCPREAVSLIRTGPVSSWPRDRGKGLLAETGVSVVIATGPETEGLESCLQALDGQREEDTEISDVSDKPCTPTIRERFPWALWTQAAASDLVPQRWALGFARARRKVIALTTGQFTPGRDWLSVVRKSHELYDAPAIGGPIDPPEGGRAT